jgi:hypothetical protein
MFGFQTLIEIVTELLRTLLVETFSEWLAGICGRLRRGPRGMKDVRRHIHRQCRRKLQQRLSTSS